MKKIVSLLLVLFCGAGLWGQSAAPSDDTAQLRQEIEQLKKTIVSLEQRLDAQEKTAKETAAVPADQGQTTSITDLKDSVKDLNERVNVTERKTLADRLQWSGDFRVEGHSIFGNIPDHYDGMQMQSLMTKTLWLFTPTSQGGLGMPFDPSMFGQMTPDQFGSFLGQQVQQNYSQYQYFTNNVTYNNLNQAVSQFSPAMRNQLMQYLSQVPGVYQKGYDNDEFVFTNRLRLRINAQIADNISFDGRLSMYKAFGDSTGVQVFNGQPNTLAIDGTTSRVPNSDLVRVERAFFNWNNIGGSKLYLSIGRRPSTEGPPMNFRQDELRAGSPSGTLINYQFDGVTVGYHLTEKTTLRGCYGVGYMSGFGNGMVLKTPADRVKSVQFFGGNVDIFESDKSLLQVTVARAWNVTDGFNGQVVLPVNPVTGDPITAPVILRYTPSANLGAINLYGVNYQTRLGSFDVYASGNMESLRPNGVTTPFGGLGSDPYETPTDHNGGMVLVGLRFNVPQNDGRTKFGFEFNHGSKYWFNFAQADDDIIGPKTSTRGQVYETYFLHRITDHFLLKADYIRYNYTWSGSGWHLGAPKRLDSVPVLGFPTYDTASMFSLGLTARF